MVGQMRRALLTLLPLGIAGCASFSDFSKEPLPVSVSAANYSALPEDQVYARVNAQATNHPTPPAVAEPSKPLFYAFVPGEVYASDTPLETVYRELAVPLAHRGYFNVVYEAQAGYLPDRVDYLLRINCGVRRWRTPTVRTDRVTWGDSGLSPYWHIHDSAYLIGPESNTDARAGQDPMSAASTAAYLQTHSTMASQSQNQYTANNIYDNGATRDYGLVVVEAFRFSDVTSMKKNAPCIWATFIALPLHHGQEFSGMLRTMVHTATPYFGTTTDGTQVFEIPPGKVLMGNPVEVPSAPRAPQPTGQASP